MRENNRKDEKSGEINFRVEGYGTFFWGWVFLLKLEFFFGLCRGSLGGLRDGYFRIKEGRSWRGRGGEWGSEI